MKISKRNKQCIIFSIIAFAITFALGALLSGINANEGFYDCKISSWKIDATLEDDGDLHVIDTLKFESDGYHFFEYEIGYGKNIIEGSGTDSSFDYSSIKVSVYNKQGHYYFDEQSVSTSNSSSYFKNGNCLGFSWNPSDCEDGGYKLNNYTKNQTKELVYVYLEDGLDSTIYFKYEYTIKNALNKYNDISELNWQFASPLEEMGVENIELNLSLPSKCSQYQVSSSWEEQGILAFGHGNGQSSITTFTNTNIQTKTDKLIGGIGDVLELRVVIPNSPVDCFNNVTSNNMISSSKTGREIIEQEELRLKELDESITSAYGRSKTKFIVFNLLSSVALLGILVLVYHKYDKERKPEFDMEYLREAPSKIMPSELSYLVNEQEITTESFTANMISLIRKKYLEIDSNGSLLTDEKANYSIRKAEDTSNKEALNEDEEFVMDLLFNKLFKDGSFTMEEFEKQMKEEDSATTYSNSISKWKKKSIELAKKKKYFDNIAASRSFSILGFVGIALTIYSLLAFYLLYYLPTLYIIFGAFNVGIGVFMISYCNLITRKSKYGIEEYTKWMAFKKFLCEFSHFEDYDIMSVVMWDEFLVYANVLGIAELVEKQMRIKLKDHPLEETTFNSSYSSMDYFFIYWHMNRVSRRMVFYSNLAYQTMVAAKAARAAKTAGKIAGSGRFGGSSSFGGGGHGGRAG